MSEQEATFINFQDEDAVDLGTLPGGTEAQLKIVDAKMGTSKTGSGDYIMLRLEIVGESFMKDVSEVIMFPSDNQDAKSNNNRKLRHRNFRRCFDIPPSYNTNEIIGKIGWVILNEKEDEEYGKQNRIKSYVVGR